MTSKAPPLRKRGRTEAPPAPRPINRLQIRMPHVLAPVNLQMTTNITPMSFNFVDESGASSSRFTTGAPPLSDILEESARRINQDAHRTMQITQQMLETSANVLSNSFGRTAAQASTQPRAQARTDTVFSTLSCVSNLTPPPTRTVTVYCENEFEIPNRLDVLYNEIESALDKALNLIQLATQIHVTLGRSGNSVNMTDNPHEQDMLLLMNEFEIMSDAIYRITDKKISVFLRMNPASFSQGIINQKMAAYLAGRNRYVMRVSNVRSAQINDPNFSQNRILNHPGESELNQTRLPARPQWQSHVIGNSLFGGSGADGPVVRLPLINIGDEDLDEEDQFEEWEFLGSDDDETVPDVNISPRTVENYTAVAIANCPDLANYKPEEWRSCHTLMKHYNHCSICMSAVADVFYRPCDEPVTCLSCERELLERILKKRQHADEQTCPLCRGLVRNRIYISPTDQSSAYLANLDPIDANTV